MSIVLRHVPDRTGRPLQDREMDERSSHDGVDHYLPMNRESQTIVAEAMGVPRTRTRPPRTSLRRLRGTQRSGGNSVRRIVTFGLCALALPMLAAGQTKDDFRVLGSERKRRLDVC